MATFSSRLMRAVPSLSQNAAAVPLRQTAFRASFQPSLNEARTATSVSSRGRGFHTTVSRLVVHKIETGKEFQEAIKKHDVVVLDAFAEWCGPCKAIAPLVEGMSDSPELSDIVHFAKFDVDQLPELTAELGVRAMPTFLLFKDGKKVDESVGADPRGLLTKILAIVP